ncbi:hypothetical protein [Bdellovibrio sp. HCB337]|uniref:hypothetical protein n=1 Tax=Bdellovibrio sp. HCB337 TaxID=3394358 RepID=UPI0039A712B3
MNSRHLYLALLCTTTLAACSPQGTTFHTGAGTTTLGSTANTDNSGTEKENTDSPQPEPAEPPPVTLGSYPWIIVTGYHYSHDSKVAIFKGISWDENWDDDEPLPDGTPFFSGYVIRKDDRRTKYPIEIEDARKGRLSFTVPASWVHEDMLVVLSGPGYQNEDFRVCDFEN